MPQWKSRNCTALKHHPDSWQLNDLREMSSSLWASFSTPIKWSWSSAPPLPPKILTVFSPQFWSLQPIVFKWAQTQNHRRLDVTFTTWMQRALWKHVLTGRNHLEKILKTTEYCGGWGWWEEHLIHQREFKTVSTHNHEGEGLAGSPVVSSTPEISPLRQYRVLLYPV